MENIVIAVVVVFMILAIIPSLVLMVLILIYAVDRYDKIRSILFGKQYKWNRDEATEIKMSHVKYELEKAFPDLEFKITYFEFKAGKEKETINIKYEKTPIDSFIVSISFVVPNKNSILFTSLVEKLLSGSDIFLKELDLKTWKEEQKIEADLLAAKIKRGKEEQEQKEAEKAKEYAKWEEERERDAYGHL